MSRKDKESSILSDRFYEKIFKIKLRGNQVRHNNVVQSLMLIGRSPE